MDTDHQASPARRRGAPPLGERLSRDTVVTRAGELIERDGLTAFSVRALAEELGVRPNALYNHVRNRDDLLDAVTERFVATIRLPAAARAWPDTVRDTAVELRSQLARHPARTELLLARAGSTGAGPAVLHGFLETLTAAGVDRALAHVAWHAVLTAVVGSVQQQRARDGDRGQTFEAVLDIVLAGLAAAAGEPPSDRATALLRQHRLAQE